ncbi:MAG: hypothetical protein GF317_03935 [Candidatus Lokiarchaeota archaeon]|nr:hypothetical protein [Candidatus Lokiarchaeota archaeon]MBD3199036.1 hypothetical protein [Candidatus Lokiarchaeota archaeon]
MKLEHFALSSKSIEDSDEFFGDILGFTKTRDFQVNADLMEQFFGVKKEQQILRYEKDTLSAEIFINKEEPSVKDTFTHICLVVEDRDKLIKNLAEYGYDYVKVTRKDKESYYLFIKDKFGNIYEIK